MSESCTSSWHHGLECRRSMDRRAHAPHRSFFSIRGQRAQARRAEDAVNYYVDRYDAHLLLITLSILSLCCLDALFTLSLINAGIAYEINPVMRVAMEESVSLFLGAKFGVTAFGIMVLLTHKNFYLFRRIKVGYALYGVLFMYAVLIKYELWLFSL